MIEVLWNGSIQDMATDPSSLQSHADVRPSMRTRRIVPVAAALLYVASLVLPTGEVVIRGWTRIGSSSPAFRGYVAFVVALFAPGNPSWETALMFASWLANPLFWLGCYWCLKGRMARAAITAGASLVLGLSILPWAWDLVAGWPGYWVWLASFLSLGAGSLLKSEGRCERLTPVE
jgi:hypothetical protein